MTFSCNRRCSNSLLVLLLTSFLTRASALVCGSMTEAQILNSVASSLPQLNWKPFTEGSNSCGLDPYGLTCDGSGSVTEVRIMWKDIPDPLPPQLFCLPSLTTVSLSSNELSVIPESICEAQNLEYVYLDCNKFSSMPACMSSLTKIKVFSADFNVLTSFPDISAWTSLNRLSLKTNLLTQVPDGIASLSLLTHVSLNENKIVSLPSSFGTFNPEYLYLHVNDIADVPPSYCDLTNMVQLSLQQNKIQSLPDCFQKLTKATYLSFYDNQLTALPPSISEMTWVTNIDAYRNKIAGSFDVSKLTNLRVLDMRENALVQMPTGWSAAHTVLNDLKVQDNLIEELPASLSTLPALQYFNASGNKLTSLPAEFQSASGIEYVYLANNMISGSLVFASDSFSRLELDGNLITSIDISQCPIVEFLNASNNPLQSLDMLPSKLRHLVIADTKVTDIPNLPASLGLLSVENSCVNTDMAPLMAQEVYQFDASCSYVKETDGFKWQEFVDANPWAVFPPLTTDFSTCQWLHCPNAQEDPVAPGREEISFNEFGPCRAGYECSGIGPGTPCPVNTYSLGGETTCPNVPAGSYTNTATRDVLTPCEAGYKCAGGDAPREACVTDGTYAPEGASECLPCDGRRQITDAAHTTCTTLTGDQFADANHLNVVTCGAGSFMMNGVCIQCVRPFKCPGDGLMAKCDSSTAEYQDEKGQSVCKTAEEGFYVRSDHSGVESCPVGHFCVDGVKEPCSTGQYQDKTEQGECPNVPKGFFTDTTTRDELNPCPAGSACAGLDTGPSPCGANTYALEKFGECLNVPAGSYTNTVTRDVLTACEAGKKCAGLDAPPEPCSHGSYSTGGASGCDACSGWRQITGPNHDKCETTGNQFADADHLYAVTCGAGSYMVNGVCTTCPKAHKCPGDGLKTFCDGIGEYQDAEGQDECELVPAGHYVDLDTRTKATPCPQNFECTGGDDQPAPCTGTSFAPEGSESCSVCDNLSGSSYCKFDFVNGMPTYVLGTCPSDSYITDSTRTECIACESGYSCDGTTKHDKNSSMGHTIGVSVGAVALLMCVGGGAWFLVKSGKLPKWKKEPKVAEKQYEFEIMPTV